MIRTRSPLVLAALLLGTIASRPARSADSDEAEIKRVADRIDLLLEASWKENGVEPAELVDDATYLRRVSLDIAGRVPTVAEVRRFRADESPTKRRDVVDRLLEGRGYVRHATQQWSAVMIPEAETNQQARFMQPGFELWLYDRLDRNTPYDELVREVLTTPLSNANNVYAFQNGGALTPVAFYAAKETKPENLAAATTRAFLGVRLECAQCHDHPFDVWERKQFWQTAAFFSGINRQNGQPGLVASFQELFTSRTLRIPDTTDVVSATYLDGTQPTFESTPRATLANWITARENPYFAKAAVNRLWGGFFGRGIVEPVDDFTAGNPPTHPEVLDELAAAFVDHDFDLRFVTRVITTTRAYQRSSRQAGASPNDPELFQRMAVKGLSAEQLYDSLATATGHHDPNAMQNVYYIANDERSRFIETFRDAVATPTTRQATILQALTMMNGDFVERGTNPKANRLLTGVVDYPFGTPRERIDTLHLATLGRPATDAEAERLQGYVDAQPEKERGKAYADVFWALLNSSEFATNH